MSMPESQVPTQPAVSVVIPIFNEEAAIADDLRVIQSAMDKSDCPFEIIVVDDGSTDCSADIVSRFPNVKLLRHPFNRGTGAALKTGISAAGGDVVVMTDGDGTYPNHEIPRLLAELKSCDMVIGARTSEQGSLRFLRTPAKTFIRWLASYLTETKIPDLNSGLRAFKRDLAIKFFNILPQGHSFVSTITLAFLSSGLYVRFVPIEYYRRKGGRSKFHPLADTYSYVLLVVRSIVYFNPLKVFLPLSFALGSVGALKVLYDIYAYNFHLAPSTLLLVMTSINLGAIGLLADLIVKRSRES